MDFVVAGHELSNRRRELLRLAHMRAFWSDRAHFHCGAILQRGALARDFHCFLESFDIQHEVTADRFLGFCERPVRNSPPATSRNDLTLVFQWGAADGFAFPA